MEFKINTELNKLQMILGECFPAPSHVAINEFIEVGEWGLALETTCDLLYEYEISITAETYQLIQKIGHFLQLDSNVWEDLCESITGT